MCNHASRLLPKTPFTEEPMAARHHTHLYPHLAVGVSGYGKGCRCEGCRSGWSLYRKQYRKREYVAKKIKEYKSRARTKELWAAWSKRPDVIARRHERNRHYREHGCYKRAYIWRREQINLTKCSRGCVDCGYNANPVALQFDHVRGKKKFVIAASYLQRKWPDVLAEIAKCEVRCANCHAVVTYNRMKKGKLRTS